MTQRLFCPHCGSQFYCEAGGPGRTCWCNAYPPLLAPDPATSCMCPGCLERVIREKIQALAGWETPRNAELPEAFGYNEQQGSRIFRAWFSIRKDNCCGQGCSPCPHGYQKNQQP